MQATLRSAQASVNAINVTTYTSQAASTAASVTTQLGVFNYSKFVTNMNSIDASVAGISFASIYSSVTALQSALVAVNTTTLRSAAADLRSFETLREMLLANLSAVAPSLPGPNPAGDYILLAQSYCTLNTSRFCTVAGGGCGPSEGTCVAAATGTRRCSASAQDTQCLHDGDCSLFPGTHCLGDYAKALALMAVLDAGASMSLNMSELTQALLTMRTNAGGADMSSANAQLAAAAAAAASIDVTTTVTSLSNIAVAAAAVDVTGAQATLASANTSLAAVPVHSFSSDINALASTVTDLEANKRPLVMEAASVRVCSRACVRTLSTAFYGVRLARRRADSIRIPPCPRSIPTMRSACRRACWISRNSAPGVRRHLVCIVACNPTRRLR